MRPVALLVFGRDVFTFAAFLRRPPSMRSTNSCFRRSEKKKCVRESATTEIGGERKILSVSGAHEIGTEATA